MLKRHFVLALVALGITAASVVVETECCICGDCRGLPLPIIMPVCGASPHHIPLDNGWKCTRTVFDYRAFSIDVLI